MHTCAHAVNPLYKLFVATYKVSMERDKFIKVRCTNEERDAWREAAGPENLSKYIRASLNRLVKRKKATSKNATPRS